MANAFYYKSNKSKIDWQELNKNASRSRNVSKHVTKQRAKGIEPMYIDLGNSPPKLKAKK
jgi:phosphosulfolactate phosphohydrolase-like enzyme